MRSPEPAVRSRSSADQNTSDPADPSLREPVIEVAEDLEFRASRRRSQTRHAHQARVRQRTRTRRLAVWACTGVGLFGASAAVAQNNSGDPVRSVRDSALATLKVGSSGQQVSALQEKVGTVVDGIYGPKTRAAVRRFQRKNDLKPTGVATGKTLKALGITAKTASATEKTLGDTSAANNPTLQKIAQCESGGNPSAIGGGGLYRGKYQFSRSTWASVGGSGDPAAASEAEQDKRAAILLAQAGTSPWPVCGG